MPLSPGDKLGLYEILSKLGEGGMGTVYLAQQELPKRLVALKVIRAGFATDEVRRRFEREAIALQHAIDETGRVDADIVEMLARHALVAADDALADTTLAVLEYPRALATIRSSAARSGGVF